MERRDWLRIIDANLNRAREAARVIEDVVRFGCPDRPGLSHVVRLQRHTMAGLEARMGLTPAELLAARDVAGDPGAAAPPAISDADPADVLGRNFARIAEAVRTIEEAARALGANAGAVAFQRFAWYTLQQQVADPTLPRSRLAEARLCVLIDLEATDRPLPELAAAVAGAGAPVIQLRCKRGTDRERERLVGDVVRAISERDTLLIINDRADLAGGADGVHLGADDLPIRGARELLGGRKLIGATAHTPAEAEAAVAAGADYLGYGTVFRSPVKPERPACGPDAVAAVAAATPIPVFAIGGITLDTIAPCRAAGIDRVAVASAVGRADDPAAAVRAFLEALQ